MTNTDILLEDLEDVTNLRVQLETDALRQSIRYGNGAWRGSGARRKPDHPCGDEQDHG